MSRLVTLFVGLGLLAAGPFAGAAESPRPYALVIHGGAGVMPPGEMTVERESGYAILERGGSSLDAVTPAVKVLEDKKVPPDTAVCEVLIYHDR